MEPFSNDREALDFAASRIADEAQRGGVPLSEVELKMLYFTETVWTLPDILDVNDTFEKQYQQADYEKRISGLLKKAVDRARKRQPEEFDAWVQAIRSLGQEDRHLLIMVEQAKLGRAFRQARHTPDMWKRQGKGLAILSVLLILYWLAAKLLPSAGPYSSSQPGFAAFLFWAAVIGAIAFYGLLRMQWFVRVTVRLLSWFSKIGR